MSGGAKWISVRSEYGAAVADELVAGGPSTTLGIDKLLPYDCQPPFGGPGDGLRRCCKRPDGGEVRGGGQGFLLEGQQRNYLTTERTEDTEEGPWGGRP
jgi:hypothetical protein